MMSYFPLIVVICQTSLVLSCFDLSLEWKERHVEPLPSFYSKSLFPKGELIEARELLKPTTLDCTKKYLALAVAPLSNEERHCSTSVKIYFQFPLNTKLDIGLYSQQEPTSAFLSSKYKNALPPKCLKESIIKREYGTYKYPSPADMHIDHDSKQMKYLVLNSLVQDSPFTHYDDQVGTKCEILAATTETRCRARQNRPFRPIGLPIGSLFGSPVILPKFDATLEWQPREEKNALEARQLEDLKLDPTKLYLAAVLRPNPQGQKCYTNLTFQYQFPLHTALAYGVYSSGNRLEDRIQIRGLGMEKHPSKFPDEFSVRHESKRLKYLVIKVMIKDQGMYPENFKKQAQKETIYHLLKATSTTICEDKTDI